MLLVPINVFAFTKVRDTEQFACFPGLQNKVRELSWEFAVAKL